MKLEKYLITGGCSFSETISPWIDTWPRHLERKLSVYNHISAAMGSQGNDLIARKVIFEIFNLLSNGVKSEDILVGIMWSGPTRSSVYSDTPFNEVTPSKNKRTYIIENPTSVNGCDKYYITNTWWADTYGYVKRLYTAIPPEQLKIESFEHILRTQDFLKNNKIKCFMLAYMNEVLYTDDMDERVMYLNKMIDKDLWATEQGCYEWCKENTDIAFKPDDPHPSTEQHNMFTDKVIMPYLRGKNYV